jgi:hypothetical protein
MFLPSGPMFHHAVQDGQELPHARRQGHLLRLAGGTEAGIERPNDRIEAARGQRGHVQGRSDLGPPTPHAAPAPQGPAVPVEGGDPDQGGDLLAGEGPQFGQPGEQGRGQHRAHPGSALEQVVCFLPDGTLSDGLGEVVVGAGELAAPARRCGPGSPCGRAGAHCRAGSSRP